MQRKPARCESSWRKPSCLYSAEAAKARTKVEGAQASAPEVRRGERRAAAQAIMDCGEGWADPRQLHGRRTSAQGHRTTSLQCGLQGARRASGERGLPAACCGPSVGRWSASS